MARKSASGVAAFLFREEVPTAKPPWRFSLADGTSIEEDKNAEAQTGKEQPGMFALRFLLHGPELRLWPSSEQRGCHQADQGGGGPRRDLLRHRRGLWSFHQRGTGRRGSSADPQQSSDRHQVRLQDRP